MIFVPMTEPDHLDPLSLPQPNKHFPIRTRIDENPGTFNVQGMAKRIFTPVLTWNE
jgi:hypothetical protein